MARLDRLGPAKELAQIGAAIGREVSHPLLAAVVRKPEAELQTALDRLIGAGLLLRQGSAPYETYFFKHALVRDAAYSTLLREPRRALHAQNCRNPRKSIPRGLREAARAVGASLHRSGANRESRGAVGQSRTAVGGNARRWSKPRNSSGVRSTRSQPWPQRPPCVVKKSSFRLHS